MKCLLENPSTFWPNLMSMTFLSDRALRSYNKNLLIGLDQMMKCPFKRHENLEILENPFFILSGL